MPERREVHRIDFWAVFTYNRLELKRKTTLFVLLAMGIFLGYCSFISWSIGFLMAKYLGGKTTGERGRLRSFVIPLRRRKIHLHHWLLASLAIVITLVYGIDFLSSDLLYGFFGGIVFQGIYCYGDWHKVLAPRRVQSLVTAKKLAIEKFAHSLSSTGMEEEHSRPQTPSDKDKSVT